MTIFRGVTLRNTAPSVAAATAAAAAAAAAAATIIIYFYPVIDLWDRFRRESRRTRDCSISCPTP